MSVDLTLVASFLTFYLLATELNTCVILFSKPKVKFEKRSDSLIFYKVCFMFRKIQAYYIL